MSKRIAMWSGPRNISTAMMRSWENRVDCSVVDEPFYAHYLQQTQSPHPMFDEVLAAQSNEFSDVVDELTLTPLNVDIQYQKHMTHHMLPDCDLQWTKHLTHCFLIRDPAYVVNSYTQSRGVCHAEDIGIKRQYELYTAISEITGQSIPIIDSVTVLTSPEVILRKMCAALNIAFSESMLIWPKGRRDSDGVWASHWYHSVEQSTHFAAPSKASFTLTAEQQRVVDEVAPYYEALKHKAITA